MAESSRKRAAPKATMGRFCNGQIVERSLKDLDAFADMERLMMPRVRILVEGYEPSLPEDDIKKALTDHFNSDGDVEHVSIPRDPETGLVDGHAFIVLCGHGAEGRALGLNGSRMGGCTLRVKVTPEDDEETARYERSLIDEVLNDQRCWFGTCVEGFDTSLPADVIKSALIDHFFSCGEITHFFLPRVFEIETLTGEAHIYFSTQEGEDKALTLNGSVMRGRKLVVWRLPTARNINSTPRLGLIGCSFPAHSIEMAGEIHRKMMAFKRSRRMV